MDDQLSGKKSKVSKLCLNREDSASETKSIGKKDKSRKGRKKRQKRGTHIITKPQWVPQDDYLLINSVVQLCDLLEVYEQVKFSKKYSFKDIEHRWKDLMNSESRTYVALEAINKLTELEKFSLDRYIPFNEIERNHVSKIMYKDVYEQSSNSCLSLPSLEPFKTLLSEKRHEFYRSRTPKDLFKCWSTMRKYGLIYPDPLTNSEAKKFDLEEMEFRMICGKDRSLLPSDRTVLGQSSSNNNNNDDDFMQYVMPEEVLQALLLEKQKQRKRLLRRLRCASEEANRWTQAVERVLNASVSDSQPSSVFATLSSHVSRFLIKSRQTSFGRATEGIQPDINLSCESYSQRISRIHGYIYLNEEDIFFIGNLARRPIFVNGTPLFKDEEMVLADDSMIMIERIALRFSINKCAVQDMKPLFPTNPSQLSVHSSIPLVFGPITNSSGTSLHGGGGAGGGTSTKPTHNSSSRSNNSASSLLKRTNPFMGSRSTSLGHRHHNAFVKGNSSMHPNSAHHKKSLTGSATTTTTTTTSNALNNNQLTSHHQLHHHLSSIGEDGIGGGASSTSFMPVSPFSDSDSIRGKTGIGGGGASVSGGSGTTMGSTPGGVMPGMGNAMPPRPRLPSQSENSRRKQRLI